MQWLILSWSLMMGYAPSSNIAIIPDSPTRDEMRMSLDNTLFTKAEFELDAWDHFRIWGSAEIVNEINPDLSALPFPIQGIYDIGAALHSKHFELGIKYEYANEIEVIGINDRSLFINSLGVYAKIQGSTR